MVAAWVDVSSSSRSVVAFRLVIAESYQFELFASRGGGRPSRGVKGQFAGATVSMAAGGSTDYSFRTRFVLVCASLGSF